jgi:hypothetical protein
MQSEVKECTLRTVTQIMTADHLLEIPDDGFRYELVRGELRKLTPAGFNHGKVVVKLTAPLAFHVDAKALGVVVGAETGFKIASDPDTVRAPDIAFVKQERLGEIGPTEKFWPGALPSRCCHQVIPCMTLKRKSPLGSLLAARWSGSSTQSGTPFMSTALAPQSKLSTKMMFSRVKKSFQGSK